MWTEHVHPGHGLSVGGRRTMIDLHSHVLPGVDDGARSIEQSLHMIASAARSGVTAIAATPHVRADYPITAKQMEAGVARLQKATNLAGLDVEILPGGEIDLDELRRRDDDELVRFGLGGNSRYLLLEFPYRGWPLSLRFDIARLVGSGITPVLAHPERNDEVQRRPRRLEPLVGDGALIQLTASSIAGAFGRTARSTALSLVRLELAHLIASDDHGSSYSRASIAEVLGDLDDSIAEWLANHVPAAIVSGDALPARPTVREAGVAQRLRAWRNG